MRPRACRPARGVALMVAMLVVTVVSTLAAAMVWQQWRAVEVESAERARTQASWILQGAADWSRLILREDGRTEGLDHLGEPWAVPLAEARLSSFLAEGKEVAEDNPALQAFLSGLIVDAQSKFNLRNVVVNGEVVPAQAKGLERLCQLAGLPQDTALRLLDALRRSTLKAEGAEGNRTGALLVPEQLTDLRWWGLEPAVIARMRPWFTLLPAPTPVNVNTAPPEVLSASIEGLDLQGALRIVAARNTAPFRGVEQLNALVPRRADGQGPGGLSVSTQYFEVVGRLRLGERVVTERSLMERRGQEVLLVQRERLVDPPMDSGQRSP